MNYVQLDYTNAESFFQGYELDSFQEEVENAHNKIHGKIEPGHDSLGWIDYPVQQDLEELNRIKLAAAKVQQNSDILLVIGVGGSSIGARAAIETLTHSFQNHLTKEQCPMPKVYFVGDNFSSHYMSDLIDLLERSHFSINVISKSGNTLEPAIAFRLFRKILIEKYGEKEARSRIYVTTDPVKGSLKTVATTEGYETFIIPEDIGGRYSVLTSVGFFPIAVSGICIEEMIRGARVARIELNEQDIKKNDAYKYAVIRNILYRKGKTIEMIISYEPRFHYFFEWWKQLYAESEGKDGEGIFPTSAIYSRDLHSIGQYVQDGRRDLFETVIKEKNVSKNIVIENEQFDFDDLNYLSGKTVEYIKNQAFTGALAAHTDGGVPNLIINLPEMNAFTFGYLIYFFQKSCVMSSYLLDVNPFNQPGVEAYKSNMYVLLKKEENIKVKHKLDI